MSKKSLVLYNPNSFIFCKFCKNTYNIKTFKIHLKFCQNFLKYIKYSKSLIEWKNYKSKTSVPKEYKSKASVPKEYKSKASVPKEYKSKAPVPKEYKKSKQSIPFEDFVRNKRVIIVGPSITVEDCKLGSFIDKFDIIVRLNKSLPVPMNMYQNIGSKTDILYNSLNISDYPGENKFESNFLLRNNVKYLRCPYPPIKPFRKDILSFRRRNRGRVNFSHINTNFYKRLEINLKTRPYSGTCAIADLLHCGVKKLFVMGIDFYTYKYLANYRNIPSRKLIHLRNNHIHKREPQINLIRRFYLLGDNLIPDNILTQILTEKYKNFSQYIKNKIPFSDIFINHYQQKLELNECHNDFDKTKICITSNEISKDVDWNICINFKKINLVNTKKIIYCFNNENIDSENLRKIKKYSKKKSESSKIFILILKIFDKNNYEDPNYFYINPVFINLIKISKNKFISNKMGLSSELFLLCIFCSFFQNIILKGIDLNYNWYLENPIKKSDFIERRMLFKYLKKNNFLN